MKTNQLTFQQRLVAPTSKFFKPLMYGGAIVAAVAGGLSIFQDQIVSSGLPVPAAVLQISTVIGWIAAAVSAVSGLTVDFEALEGQK
ncbi:hypothetical protein [Siphonobacter sp. SORGH_AS_1065]|uniref:hypothetical protein n=1 Tax=Siphonobacter sp. SORGH_AS_1065 TaxID=3041795 RepID=UPI0027880D2D|nr:hypothetical protein [Siphonobacter sp. SORGH_AS_1065]MDQ1088989.1 hypothetical protein [Siphonobacter sp. SORGH_AS_1065]